MKSQQEKYHELQDQVNRYATEWYNDKFHNKEMCKDREKAANWWNGAIKQQGKKMEKNGQVIGMTDWVHTDNE